MPGGITLEPRGELFWLSHQLADDTKFRGADSTLECRSVILKDVDRLEWGANRNLLISSKDKSQLLPCGELAPCNDRGQVLPGWAAALCRRLWLVCVLGYVSRSTASGSDYPPLLSTCLDTSRRISQL